MEHMVLLLEWWFWGLVAIALMALEIIAAGFMFLGFGIGAAVVAFLLFLGWVGANVSFLTLIFAVCSMIAWLGMRKIFGLRKGQVKVWDKDINDDE
ncbi:NfeD family protein [Celeribacter sp. SCSIO 80788]|jgi:membrane protein implicated in regulation of membrane protease activity|uniref:NfeD family protein n=1 Tax=Celeribacter sp. SCSIO 80788 TaxID=3117013 RepID=UPI003DA3A976